MAVTEAQLFINSISVGGSSKGVPVGYAWDNQADYVEIPAPGKTGASAQGLIRRRLICEIEWLDGQATAIGTVGTIIISISQKDTGVTTHTMTSMKAGTYGSSGASVPFRYRQQFVNESDIDSDPLTIVEN